MSEKSKMRNERLNNNSYIAEVEVSPLHSSQKVPAEGGSSTESDGAELASLQVCVRVTPSSDNTVLYLRTGDPLPGPSFLVSTSTRYSCKT